MIKKLVVGNWKTNPLTLEEAKKIVRKVRRAAEDLNHTETVICPPFVFISACTPKKPVSHLHIGAQSTSFYESGAHTGEIAPGMLKDIGVKYVIVGHSETRRTDEKPAGDTDETVSKKAKAVLDAGLTPIVCVGEKNREENGSHLDILKEQIKGSLAGIPVSQGNDIIIAYEPIWAIGAKEPMKPEDIYEMSLFVKKVFADIFGSDQGLKVPVLYGGAVNSRNAADIVKIGQVDGLLVGRESVNATGFVELLKAVDSI